MVDEPVLRSVILPFPSSSFADRMVQGSRGGGRRTFLPSVPKRPLRQACSQTLSCPGGSANSPQNPPWNPNLSSGPTALLVTFYIRQSEVHKVG